MPLYEYECDTCGHRFEVIQKFSDAPITVCPKCQGAVRKLFSSPAIQFKGSGWYITDYAKKSGTGAGSAKNEGSSEKSAEKSGEKSGEKSSEGSSTSGDTAPKTDGGSKSTTTPSS
jgi:putative FmdB family regulatory protein